MMIVELFSQDYSEKVFSATNVDAAVRFLRDSGKDWLPMRAEWGKRKFQQRWTGRLVLQDGGASAVGEGEYLRHAMQWPNSEL